MSFLLAQLQRELRHLPGRAAPVIACLAAGACAVACVAGLSSAVSEAVRGQARELLGADLVVTGRREAPPEVVAAARSLGLTSANTIQLYSMAAAPSRRSVLVDVKAVEGPHPLRGHLELEPDVSLAELLDGDAAVVAPDLLARLALRVGDEMSLAGHPVRITGVVRREPDRIAGSLAGGPRVFVSRQTLERSALVGPGTRTKHALLLALPEGSSVDADRAEAELQRALGGSPFHEVETYRDARPELRKQIERTERYLGLVALLALLAGGASVAHGMSAWIASRVEVIATLRCLGARARDIIAIHALAAIALGIFGGVLGALGAAIVLLAAPRALNGVMPGLAVSAWQPGAFARGAGLALIATLAATLPSLLAAVAIPPWRALRHSAEPVPVSRAVRLAMAALACGIVLVLARIQAGTWPLGAGFLGLLVVAAGTMAAAGRGLSRGVAVAAWREGHVWWRLALASIARPGSGTSAGLAALGTGVLVVVSLVLVQDGVQSALEAELPRSAPTVFLVDIQPAQWPATQRVLEEGGATHVDSVPMATARLALIDERDVADMARERRRDEGDSAQAESDREPWALTREQRLTWLDALPESNRIVAGEWFRRSDGRDELSVEEDFARDIGVRVGSTVVLDVQGVSVPLVVTSLRHVEWKTFGINFFLVVEPGVLDAAPHQRVATARIPEGREQDLQDAVFAAAPNVTLIPIRELLDRLADMLAKLSVGIRVLGGLAVLAGLLVLAGAAVAAAPARRRDLAVLKTLGMTGRELTAMLAAEHALIGLIAAVLGTAGGLAIAWWTLGSVMDLPFAPSPLLAVLPAVTCAAIAGAAGLAATWRAVREPPAMSFRRET